MKPCCDSCEKGLPCEGEKESTWESTGCSSGSYGIRFLKQRVASVPRRALPGDPFRPYAVPSSPTQSMRSPQIGATSSRPGALSVEAAFANQVPLERQGPTGMTIGGETIYPTPTFGITTMPATRILSMPSRLVKPVTPQNIRPASSFTGFPVSPAGRVVSLETRVSPSAGADVPSEFISSQADIGNDARQATIIWSRMSDSAQQAWIREHVRGGGGSGPGGRTASKPDWFSGSNQDWLDLSPDERARLQRVHDSAETAQQTAQIVDTIVGATTGTIKQALDAYLGYNASENNLRIELARQETQRQLNAANAAAGNTPEARQRSADLQRAMEALNEYARQNAALLAGNQASKISTGAIVAIAAGGAVVLGTIVYLATRPRSNPSRDKVSKRSRRSSG